MYVCVLAFGFLLWHFVVAAGRMFPEKGVFGRFQSAIETKSKINFLGYINQLTKQHGEPIDTF